MESITRALLKMAPLTDEDIINFTSITTQKPLNKGDYWIEAGKKNNQVGFIEKGYLRKYYMKDGCEITDYFYFENDFTADIPSIINNNSPVAFIIAMSKSLLITFPYDEFNILCKTSPRLEHLHRLMIEMTFLRYYERTVSFITQTVKERYDRLIDSRPDILQRAAQHHIASFLGISPQHLSRIRRKNNSS